MTFAEATYVTTSPFVCLRFCISEIQSYQQPSKSHTKLTIVLLELIRKKLRKTELLIQKCDYMS